MNKSYYWGEPDISVKFCEPSDFEEMQSQVPDGYLLQEDGTLIEYVG